MHHPPSSFACFMVSQKSPKTYFGFDESRKQKIDPSIGVFSDTGARHKSGCRSTVDARAPLFLAPGRFDERSYRHDLSRRYPHRSISFAAGARLPEGQGAVWSLLKKKNPNLFFPSGTSHVRRGEGRKETEKPDAERAGENQERVAEQNSRARRAQERSGQRKKTWAAGRP